MKRCRSDQNLLAQCTPSKICLLAAALLGPLLMAGCSSTPSGPTPVSQEERIKGIESSSALPPEARERIKQEIAKEPTPTQK